MKIAKHLAGALPIVAIVFGSLAAPAAAESGNWMRDHVRDVEIAHMERVLGEEAVQELLESRSSRIVGGTQAPPGTWPAQAGLLYADEPDNYQAQYCGGSVIANRFILTAAHCVDFVTKSQIQVLVGTQSLTSGGQRINVKKIWIHRNWNPSTFNNDVAVLKLKKNVGGIKPNWVITKDEAKNKARPGRDSYVTGWGNTQTTGYPTELRQVMVPLVSRSLCNNEVSYDGDITTKMICAGFEAGGKDACQGDSGGPLVVKKNGKWRLQAGVVSWGAGCALPNYYGVYSKVSAFEGWINKKLAK